MKTSPGSHFAPIIALTLVAVISAGTLITSYVNPSLFEQFEETGSSSGGKSKEGEEEGDGKKTASEGKGTASPEGEGLEGVTFHEVDEDEATLQAMLGNSKAFELEPWEGLKVSAGENALDHDRDFQITRLDDTKYDSLQEEFEDGGAFLLDAFDVNAGLQADEYLPGYYEVSMDLSTLGVPEELYPEVVPFRMDDQGNINLFSAELEGSTLKYKSRQNSVDGFIIITAVVIGGIVYKVYESNHDEHYFNGKIRRDIKGKGNYRIVWAEEDFGAVTGTDAGSYISISDVENEKDRIQEKIRKAHPRVDPAEYFGGRQDGKTYEQAKAERRAVMLEEYKEELANSALIKQYNAQQKANPFIEELDTAMERAWEFVSAQGIRMPSYCITLYVEANVDGSDAEQHLRYFYNPCIAVSLAATLNKGGTAMEELPITLAHELFHACQHEYYTGEAVGVGANQRLFEALAGALEPDAYKYMDGKKWFPTIGGLDVGKDWEQLLTYMTTRTYEHFLVLHPNVQSSNPQGAGYLLAYLIEYLNKVSGKKSFHTILMHYACGKSLTETLQDAYGLDRENFRNVYLHFLRWMRNNRCPSDGYEVSGPLSELIKLESVPAFEKTKFTTSLPMEADLYLQKELEGGIMPYLHTISISRASNDKDHPKSLLAFPVKAEQDASFELTPRGGSFSTIRSSDPTDPTAFLFQDSETSWVNQDLIEVADPDPNGVINNIVYGSKSLIYVMVQPEAPDVYTDDTSLFIQNKGFPDMLAKELKEEAEDVAGFVGGIEVTLIRDDGEKFELDQLYEPKYWEEEIKLPKDDYTEGYNGPLEAPTFQAEVRECIITDEENYFGPKSKQDDNTDIYGMWDIEADMPNFGSGVIDQSLSLRPPEVEGNDKEYWEDYKQEVTGSTYKGTMFIQRTSAAVSGVTDASGAVEKLMATIVYEPTSWAPESTSVEFDGTYDRARQVITITQKVDTTLYDEQTAALMKAYMPTLQLFVAEEGGKLSFTGSTSMNNNVLSYTYNLKGTKQQ